VEIANKAGDSAAVFPAGTRLAACSVNGQNLTDIPVLAKQLTIAAGKTYTLRLKVPVSVVKGTNLKVILSLDPDNRLAEADETNNEKLLNITVKQKSLKLKTK
jgi:hypothetical protein